MTLYCIVSTVPIVHRLRRATTKYNVQQRFHSTHLRKIFDVGAMRKAVHSENIEDILKIVDLTRFGWFQQSGSRSQRAHRNR
jgi:hypothetical protein